MAITRQQRSIYFYRVVAMVVLLAFAMIYVSFMDRTMRLDESYTLRRYSVDLPRALLEYSAPNNHILHSTLLVITTDTIGESFLGVRFVALSAGLMALAMAYRVGSRFQNRTTGLLAMAFIGTNFIFAGYTVDARGYTLSILLTLALLDHVFFAPLPYRGRARGTFILLAFLLVLTLPTMASLILAVLIWLEWRVRRTGKRAYRDGMLPLITGTVMAGMFYAPAFIFGFIQEYFDDFGQVDGGGTPYTNLRDWLNSIFSTDYVAIILLAGVFIGLFVLVRRKDNQGLLAMAAAAFIGMVIVQLMQYLLVDRLFPVRAYIYLVVFFALIAAVGLSTIPRAIILVPIVFGVAVFPLQRLGERIEVDDFLELIDQNNISMTDTIVVGCCLIEQTWYHLNQEGRGDLLFFWPYTEQALLVETHAASLEDLIRVNQLEAVVTNCHLDEERFWGKWQVYACDILRDTP